MPQALALPFAWVAANIFGTSPLAAAPLAGAAGSATAAGLGGAVGKIALSVGLSVGASLLMPKPKPPQPSNGQVETQQSIPPRSFVYGRMAVSGPCAFKKPQTGAISPGLFKIILVNEGQVDNWETLYGDNQICVLDGSNFVSNGPFHQAGADKVQIFLHDGTDSQTADTFLIAQFPDLWTTDHRLRGIAYAVFAAHGTNSEDYLEAYPNGEPTFKALIRGRRVYDPRDGGQDPDDESTWMWSDNPALCILDWCATNPNGYALGLDRFDLPAFEDMADLCDELVPLNWIAASEKRYRVATQVVLTEPRTDVLGRLRMACDGHLVKVGSGVWGIRGGKWTAPGVTIDASQGHILQAETRAGVDAMTRYNEVDLRYLSEDHGYAEQECDPWQRTADAEYIAGKLLRNQMDLTMVPSFSQARRLAKIFSAYDNPDFIGSLTTNFYGGDTIGEQNITLLWSETTGDDVDGGAFWLDPGMVLGEDMTGMQLAIRSCDPTAYDWDEAAEEGTRPKPLPPSPMKFIAGTPPTVPPDFAVSPGTRSATATWTFESVHDTSDNDDNHRYAGRVWRAAAGAGFANAIEVSGPRYRYRLEEDHVETWTDSVQPGNWDYYLTIENGNGDISAPTGPISVTVT